MNQIKKNMILISVEKGDPKSSDIFVMQKNLITYLNFI